MADPNCIPDYGQPAKASPGPIRKTLIRLGLFLVICFALLVAVLPVPSPRGGRHDKSSVQYKLTLIATALNNFRTDMGRFPTAEEGLNILIVTTPTRPQYIDTDNSKPLIDTWGHPFIYTPPGNGKGKGEIRSCGPDGICGTADDVVISLEVPQTNP